MLMEQVYGCRATRHPGYGPSLSQVTFDFDVNNTNLTLKLRLVLEIYRIYYMNYTKFYICLNLL